MPVYTLVLRLVVAVVALTALPWCQSLGTGALHLDPGAALHTKAFLNALQHFQALINNARHAQPQPAHKHLSFRNQSSIQHKPGQSEHVQGVVGLMG